jgi:predicted transcriptional regulator of viral defense system
MTLSKAEQALELARKLGVLRPRDLKQHGIAREYLTRLTQQGALERVGRGLYIVADAELSENHSLAEAARRAPEGVVCLLSALRFHDLTTQAPFEVWLALPSAAWRPRLGSPPLRIVRFSGPALTEGIEDHIVEGVRVRVYTPAKTVADCFKFRNKIGLDVALEALRETWSARRATMEDLWSFAEICRVTTVMRPYLESLLSLEGLT